MKKQNPFDLHSVTPYLVVSDAERLISFIEHSLNGKLRGEPNYAENGKISHAEMKIGDSVIMLMDSDETYKPTNSSLYVYVNDCDASIKAAIKQGAKLFMKSELYPHGDKYGSILDPFGNLWFLATHVGR